MLSQQRCGEGFAWNARLARLRELNKVTYQYRDYFLKIPVFGSAQTRRASVIHLARRVGGRTVKKIRRRHAIVTCGEFRFQANGDQFFAGLGVIKSSAPKRAAYGQVDGRDVAAGVAPAAYGDARLAMREHPVRGRVFRMSLADPQKIDGMGFVYVPGAILTQLLGGCFFSEIQCVGPFHLASIAHNVLRVRDLRRDVRESRLAEIGWRAESVVDERNGIAIMGVVNATPDSFSDGGQFGTAQAAVDHALQLAEDGADILDVGGESTRPGATAVAESEELDRTIPIIEAIAAQIETPISVDTRKAAVARAAVAAGASIWNDVSALRYDENSVETAASLGCEVVLMHAQGDPRTMQDQPHYEDVVVEVIAFLAGRIELCVAAGVDRAKIIADPGIGFGKTLAHNLALLARLNRLQALEAPILLGASRKRFIAALDRDGPAADRLGGSIAAVLAGYARGASIFRVHDVAATRQALNIAKAIETADLAR